ncbi:LLM class flavin-dependent oxidoreductase [Actinomadura rupiterrae]|uniref:LLM class flavin-dependent oxidoreductase n=1 Tax=Actinomadura rupiterrae TaxID=559627 RepID=UPI0020A23C26|nr:LLM class flavin-dependent oxidoreductase [Actinomadura rupiterrae]MCP2340160.1 alkanesulfonate monooxygenase SsuD/methylene tetrahydromethanopterin reductase-like flavin-dependent oxidoreductase (luciferase family) [Actinomadura rupiterrae]
MNGDDRLGIVFGSLTPPEELATGAELAERLGFGELWFSEDCFFTGGVSGLTQMLASTGGITAGLGLASVITRHPAVLAMELAGLARLYPGRTRATIGLGNVGWLKQMGLVPDRPLTAVLETFDVLRALLDGRTVSEPTSAHHFDGIELAFPPEEPPELWIGAVNRRALRAAGAKADGVLLSVLAGPEYVAWARDVIAEGAAEAGRPLPRITAFALSAADADASAARDAVRQAVGFFLQAEAHTDLVGRSPHAEAVRKALDGDPFDVPDAWIDEFAVAGTPEQVAARLGDLNEAGADSVGLWLFPAERYVAVLQTIADEVLPRLGRQASPKSRP